MADNKFPKGIKFITPRGVFVYPKLNKADTKYKAEGQYSTKLRLADIGNIPAEKINALLAEFAEQTKKELTEKKNGAKAKNLKVKQFDLTEETDRESGEPTGNLLLNAKMTASGVSKKDGKPWTRKPKLFDAKGTEIKNPKQIWGGTEGKLSVEAVPYYTPKDNECGITLRLEAAQILKLVSGSDKDAAGYGFGEEEGYTDEGASGFKDESGEDSENPAPAAGAGDEF